ncbi:helix-turn-helix domain-containing protein [Streptomyces sp. MMBL 11-3]|uniref:helix-turn-helix domain-containing protein n=1 Tax=Streptomyces sp. MMBL 11-3 TaxID=3382639 RepID=UPI0039B6BA38
MTQGAPSPSGARLAAVLQELRQRTGLSLAQLAQATTFSKSSWERYLNGKGLPPRSAVEELCRLAGESADRPLALLDIARAHRTAHGTTRGTHLTPQGTGAAPSAPGEKASDDTGPGEAVPAGTGAIPAPARPVAHRRVVVLTALASVCALVLGALVLVNLPPSHREEAASASPTSPASPPATGPFCRHTACQDKDPVVMKCGAEPLTLAEHETATGAWVQIRYSQECGTSWVRMWGAAVGDRVDTVAGGRGGPVTARGSPAATRRTPTSTPS